MNDAISHANNDPDGLPAVAVDIVMTLREPLLVLDPCLRVKAASRAFYRVFQVNPEETIGRNIFDLGNGQWDIPALRKLLVELLPTHSTFDDYTVEHDFPDIGKRIMLLNARRLVDRDDQFGLILLAIADITDRRAAEELQKISEIRYRRLFEAAHDGILIVGVADRKITDVNPFLLDFLDYPREYFIGKELWEIGMFKDKAASEAAMKSLDVSGTIRYENLPLQNRNGRQRPVEVVANIYQEDHQPVIQCNVRDISERAHFEAERLAHLVNEQSLRMECQAANRSKDLFLATLSHEMRTPLNAIVGWMSILRQEGRSPADLEEGLDVIDRNTRVQVKLIEDVLDVSRIVSGKLRLETRPCQLTEVVKAGLEVMRPAANAKNISLVANLDPATDGTICDPVRIQQVVWNLVSNAVKFTPKGGASAFGFHASNQRSKFR